MHMICLAIELREAAIPILTSLCRYPAQSIEHGLSDATPSIFGHDN
jgi:hypothetical protein